MPRPFTLAERARYEAVRRAILHRMADDGRTGRITVAEVQRALLAAGYDRGYEYVKAVLNGRKRSRPMLREVSAAVRAVRERRLRRIPDWM
jgi:hypothetical protein